MFEIGMRDWAIDHSRPPLLRPDSSHNFPPAMLLWSELEQPFTNEVKERTRQRLRERDISPSATAEEKRQEDC